ncbi:hypothetical protein MUNTM_29160 [Mycobacterium sp. MUNTM1]
MHQCIGQHVARTQIQIAQAPWPGADAADSRRALTLRNEQDIYGIEDLLAAAGGFRFCLPIRSGYCS